MFLLFLQHFLSSNKNLVHQLGSISSTTLATSSVVFFVFFFEPSKETQLHLKWEGLQLFVFWNCPSSQGRSWATQTCLEALIVVEQGRPFKAIPGYQHRVYTSRSAGSLLPFKVFPRDIQRWSQSLRKLKNNVFKYRHGYVLYCYTVCVYINIL